MMTDKKQKTDSPKFTWDMVALRLAELGKHFSRKEGKHPASPKFHCARLTISVYVNPSGQPMGWESPVYSRLEPSGAWVESMPFCQDLNHPVIGPNLAQNDERDINGSDYTQSSESP